MVPPIPGLTPPASSGGWRVEVRRGSVADGHGPVGAFDARTVLCHEPVGPALVLGSGQRVDDGLSARADAAGLAVVRRRSGGGAVLVVPGPVWWVDVLVPRGDPLWDDDVGRSAVWLGEAWRDALEAVGVAAEVVDRMSCGAVGRSVCFAGRAVGEVLVGGRKVVGVSQRRDRYGARFQCAALVGPDAVEASVVPLVGLLGPWSDGASDDELATGLRAVVGWIEAPPDALLEAFLRALGAAAR